MFDQIVYIHGFHGSITSPKVQAMRTRWKHTNVVAPEYPDEDAAGSHAALSSFIRKSLNRYPNMLLTGCSLGGFWATYLSNEFKMPSLLMNPAHSPWDTLSKYAGEGEFTQKQVDAFKRFENKLGSPETVYEPRIVLLEKGDTVIDPIASQKVYTGHGMVKLLPGGSHRFDNFTMMNAAIEELGNTIIQHTKDI